MVPTLKMCIKHSPLENDDLWREYFSVDNFYRPRSSSRLYKPRVTKCPRVACLVMFSKTQMLASRGRRECLVRCWEQVQTMRTVEVHPPQTSPVSLCPSTHWGVCLLLHQESLGFILFSQSHPFTCTDYFCHFQILQSPFKQKSGPNLPLEKPFFPPIYRFLWLRLLSPC